MLPPGHIVSGYLTSYLFVQAVASPSKELLVLGALFGFIEGVIVVGVALFYAMQVLPNDTLRNMLETSWVADFLITTMTALQVFFPESIRQAFESAADATVKTVPSSENRTSLL